MSAGRTNAVPVNPVQSTIRRRLPLVIGGLIVFSLYLLWTMVSFQYLSPSVTAYMDTLRDSNYGARQIIAAQRGRIFDRDGQPLAVNTVQYAIGISPTLVSSPRRVATQLAAILNMDELRVYELATGPLPWALLARPVSAEVGQRIADLDLLGVTIDPLQRRRYPQGTLAAHVIGFVAGSDDSLRGYLGIEGKYEDQLAGRIRAQEVSTIPFDIPLDDQLPDRGKDVVLTLDRDIQFLIESELQLAMDTTGAQGGTIIVMNPRNGDILAMASYPSFDPNAFYDVSDQRVLNNPAISTPYEPGSIMKVLTVAAALDAGIITPQWTYNDQARIEIGGIVIQNWDRRAHGAIDVTQVLVQSLNVGAATISLQMGPDLFYNKMRAFGIGQLTGVDLQGEVAGTLRLPGDPDWSEADLGTNAFGQGVSVTPLQILTAVNAIANGGLMMQPRIVYQIVDGTDVYTSQPTALGRVITADTAQLVTQMMVATVRDGVDLASVPGYAIAGKSGTAEISDPGVGYLADQYIMSFVGFFPADDPQVSILVKLDRPTSASWASQTAAPVFQRIADRLMVLLEIPQDAVRLAIAAQGGSVNDIPR